MAKKIDDGKSQIILIVAVVVFAVFMLFGMFNKNGKSAKSNTQKTKNTKIKKSKEKKEVSPKISDGYQVLKVSDGDTINIQKVENGQFVGEELRIRMYGMDAPEKSQDYGPESRQALEKLVAGKTLSIEVKNKDRYGRTVAIIYVDGKNINEEMVKTGNAWWYQEYAKNDTQFEEYQKNAKQKKLGLFSRKGYIEPWVYRRNKKENVRKIKMKRR
ncbi:thermonuclease family protein [Leptotrichia sp. oral taxon 847]|uniref:thermonuclease family protein n=1 Tax=Leptotrichia sp. oral taxon 847 TaxID=1785996 RepID=UPI000767FA22|nr:thermonuclease family protein [Leptotrichia sp. oral taxon 847]AMD94312.1 nuclease [Leptotrichia sp. oral taxon 847]